MKEHPACFAKTNGLAVCVGWVNRYIAIRIIMRWVVFQIRARKNTNIVFINCEPVKCTAF
ncbi:hypothetical protein BH688_14720 [Kushneria phosphatilytica]|nr:hypothetical protein BH688_14720 [Kushneria phosphatilytica]